MLDSLPTYSTMLDSLPTYSTMLDSLPTYSTMLDSLITFLWALTPLILLVLLSGNLHMKEHWFLPIVFLDHCWKFLCKKVRKMFHKKSRCHPDGGDDDCRTDDYPVLRIYLGCYYSHGLLHSSAQGNEERLLEKLDAEMQCALEVSTSL